MDTPSSTPKVPDVKKIFTDSGFHNLANLVDYFEKDKNTVELTLLISHNPTKVVSLAPALKHSSFTFGSKTGEITPLDTLQLLAEEEVGSLNADEKRKITKSILLKIDVAAFAFFLLLKKFLNKFRFL